MGRASDSFPTSIPHVIARKVAKQASGHDLRRIWKIPNREETKKIVEEIKKNPTPPKRPDDLQGSLSPKDVRLMKGLMLRRKPDPVYPQVVECIGSIRDALISRMDFYGIPFDVKGSQEAAAFNAKVKPEEVDDNRNPYRMDWVTSTEDVVIGYKV